MHVDPRPVGTRRLLIVVAQLRQLLVTPWTAVRQASLSITNHQSWLKYTPVVLVMPSNHLVLCHAFSSFSQSFPASGSFQMSWLFTSSGQSIRPSALVLLMNTQGWFPLGLTGVLSPCSPRDSQESFPAPQFESISSLALSLFYDPTLTSVHDYWKNNSFD